MSTLKASCHTNTTSPFSSPLAHWFNEPFEYSQKPAGEHTYQPRVDIVHSKNFSRLEFELPGVSKEAVNVEVKEQVLTVTADCKSRELKEDEEYYLQECRKGKFKRQFRLGNHLNVNEVDAQFENGILSLTIKKKEESLSKKINIR
jgi:HSP20 family protein